jgi:hypothetical protein
MTAEHAKAPIDRSGWPKGPWDDEPDRHEWRTKAGYPGLAVRHSLGHWCGYVAVPPGHAAYGKDDDAAGVSVHGGITYASVCNGDICHVPEPGEPDDVYWLGFDCAHSRDAAPNARISAGWDEWDGAVAYWGPAARSQGDKRTVKGEYRNLHYVIAECENLSAQLRDMRGGNAGQ